MIQAIIKFGEHEDRILNIVKGKYGLKNKSDAVNLIINKFETDHLEPELRPEFIEKINKIEKEDSIRFDNIDELKKIIES
jgi:hypothetical protein